MKVTDSFHLILNSKPASYNKKKPSHLGAYRKNIRDSFQRNCKGKLEYPDLYGLIVYLYREDKNLDADNLSKPVWDALNGLAYEDDSQIKIRTAIKLDISRQMINFDMIGYLDDKVQVDIVNSMAYNDHTVYIEIGKINDFSTIFQISSLWK